MDTALTQRWGLFVGLGVISFALGIVAWVDALVVSLASTIVLGVLLFVVGAVQLVHAFVVRDWSGRLMSILGGALYILAGTMMMEEPAAGTMAITLFISACLVVSGIGRIIMAFQQRGLQGWWLILMGGLISLLVGVCLYATLPWSGLWLIGTFVAVELIAAGLGWIQFGLALRQAAYIPPAN
ncbi:hdeD [Komagataeibacter rhaeticus]|uniref:HdeD family acid-resistance protein n=1 Tax=Komagataeibacter rhaeticus TaxID=215221 RepID=A0A181C845_9PROT|nr:HdeD family acid-resistance protein [Komagataeibacter rhaeticus]ATU73517.1 hdeD [Komagataeibacter xylinus]KDU95369.1 hdeD [Komagataeibacter rhaeticus AF1]MBL7239955.1 HdeD family acid-resistance protein [Komagataeibacter rhaeticus]PYD54043.1 hdeD [Komagataeibacter rhaeticus]QIP34652.1 HdeD family acid-resistance protein [Komagataeibacter rhaeticus]